MDIEASLKERLMELLSQASGYMPTTKHVFPDRDVERNYFQIRQAQAGAWLASALAIVRAILHDPEAPHRKFIERLAGGGPSGNFEVQVLQVSQVLGNLELDLKHGLFKSITDAAVALAYVDLLDHADEYLKFERVDVAGVIAGVSFEDSMRRVRAQRGILPEDIAIEDLIVEFAKQGILSNIEAKRARAAAAVRTSATHARWSEFGKNDVESCIHFTRQFVSKAQ